MKINYAAISYCGDVRRGNRDRIFLSQVDFDGQIRQEANGCRDTETMLFALFDGLGGRTLGEKAAEIAVETVKTKEEMNLNLLCGTINENICDYMHQNRIQKMGSTAALVRIKKNVAFCCNLGDSRIYLIRENHMLQVSLDHTIEFGGRRSKRVLTQHLGIPETEMIIEPSLKRIAFKKHDRILLCSSGLTNMVAPKEILPVISELDVKEAAEKLFDSAMTDGKRKSISVILCEMSG